MLLFVYIHGIPTLVKKRFQRSIMTKSKTGVSYKCLPLCYYLSTYLESPPWLKRKTTKNSMLLIISHKNFMMHSILSANTAHNVE